MSDFLGTPAPDVFFGGSGPESIQGNLGNDTLEGGGGNDVIYGELPLRSTPNDHDTIRGGDGDDIIFGGGGSDFLSGDAGDDRIALGGGRSDGRGIGIGVITTSDLDVVEGGDGVDLVFVVLSSSINTLAVTADISNPNVQSSVLIGGVTVALLTGVEAIQVVAGGAGSNVTGGDYSDFVQVTGGTVSTGGGDDTVSITSGTADGGAGFDRLGLTVANALNYTFTLNASGQSLLLEDGVTRLTVANFEALTIITGAGNDTLTGGDNNDSLNGGTGANELDGGAGLDTGTASMADQTASVFFDNTSSASLNAITVGGVSFGSFTNIENIVFTGGAADDAITGGAGDDTINGGAGNDVLNGGGGSGDRVSYAGSQAVTISLAAVGAQNTGGGGIDTLSNFEGVVGSSFNDAIAGDAGDNVLGGEGGADLLEGAGGNDILYGGATGVLSHGHGFGDSSITGNTLDGGDGDDQLFGALGADVLWGGAGEDILRGGDSQDLLTGDNGNDVLDGGEGNDTLDGGEGVDQARYFNSLAGVTVNLALQGSIQSTVGAGNDLLTSIEGILGSGFGDTLTGDAGANALSGDAGNDLLAGGGGNDVLIGGSGSDTIDGGGNTDTISAANDAAAVTIHLAGGWGQDGWGTFDTLSGLENIIGSAFHDTLVGNAIANGIVGGEGDDWIVGLEGDDVLEGGLGINVLIGGLGTDLASYASATTGLWVNMAAGIYSATGVWDVFFESIEGVLGGSGSDSIFGNASDNVLRGGAGDDALIGNAGNDRLEGGAGQDWIVGGDGNDRLIGGINDVDVLTGGTGADLFDLGASCGWDVAFDFNTSEDSFYLGGQLWSGFLTIDADGDGATDDTLLGYGGGNFVALNVSGLTLGQWNALVGAPPAGETGGEKLLSDPGSQTLPALVETDLSREMQAGLFPEHSLDLGPEAFRGFLPQHQPLSIELEWGVG